MDRARAFVTQKLGPLPLWLWAAIGLAVILGYLYFSKSGLFAGLTGGAGTGAPQDSNLPGGIGASGGQQPTTTSQPADTMGQAVPFQAGYGTSQDYGTIFAAPGGQTLGDTPRGSSPSPAQAAVNYSSSVAQSNQLPAAWSFVRSLAPAQSPTPTAAAAPTSGGGSFV